MQSEVYRKWTLYGCGIISTAIDYFFLYADGLAKYSNVKERRNVPAMEDDLPEDALLISKDPAVLHLADIVAECRNLLVTLKGINNFTEEDIEKYKKELLSKTETELVPSPKNGDGEMMYNRIIKLIIEYIEREAVSIDFVLMLMSEFDPLYVHNCYGCWNKNNGDKNIALFQVFSENVHELREWAWNLQIRKLRGRI